MSPNKFTQKSVKKEGLLHNKVLNFLVFTATFLTLTFPYTDYDWGWHLKYGEFFFKTGHILRADIFSFTLPGYEWVNHSWLYDIFVYLTYNFSKFSGLLLITPVLFFLIFYIAIKPFKLSFWKIGVLSIFYIKLSNAVFEQGIRSQIIGLLFLSILLYVFVKGKENRKLYFSLPLIFLLWANFHASFAAGLAITFVFFVIELFISYLILNKTDIKNSIFALGLTGVSCIATLINPFTYKIYSEALRHFSSPWLQFVHEWRAIKEEDATFIIIFILGFGLLFLRKFKLSLLPFLFVAGIMFIFGFMHVRYTAMAAVTALPLFAFVLQDFEFKRDKDFLLKIGVLIFSLAMIYLALIDRIPSINYLKYSFTEYCNYGSKCSPKLMDYLIKYPPRGLGYNFYDWGGYLIGNNFQNKVFQYGAMTLWQKDKYLPFTDSLAIEAGYDQIFNKYNFDFVIIRPETLLANKLLRPSPLGIWKTVYGDHLSLYLVREGTESGKRR